jgi:hypothetical protein
MAVAMEARMLIVGSWCRLTDGTVVLMLSGRKMEGRRYERYKMEVTTQGREHNHHRSSYFQGCMRHRGIAADGCIHQTLYLALFLDQFYYGVISVYISQSPTWPLLLKSSSTEIILVYNFEE